VDELEAFLRENQVTLVDPAAEYYEDYYSVFCLDPDGPGESPARDDSRSARRSL
jgi:hypothetical protein